MKVTAKVDGVSLLLSCILDLSLFAAVGYYKPSSRGAPPRISMNLVTRAIFTESSALA